MIIFINASNPDLLVVFEKPSIDYVPPEGASLRSRPVSPGNEFHSKALLDRFVEKHKDERKAIEAMRSSRGEGISYDKLRTLPSGDWIEVDDRGGLIQFANVMR